MIEYEFRDQTLQFKWEHNVEVFGTNLNFGMARAIHANELEHMSPSEAAQVTAEFVVGCTEGFINVIKKKLAGVCEAQQATGGRDASMRNLPPSGMEGNLSENNRTDDGILREEEEQAVRSDSKT